MLLKEKPATPDVLLARQPIFNKENFIAGFELLYRGTHMPEISTRNGMSLTSELLNNICSCAIEQKLTLEKPLFINVDQTFIESPSFFPSQPHNVVLEILETVKPTIEVIQKIKKLKQLGFKFALDDYMFEDERSAFLTLVSIVKVDVLMCEWHVIESNIDMLKAHSVTLLAEKVETLDMYEKCKHLGFSLFQGYYLERPRPVHGVKVPTSKQVTLKLLTELSREDITAREVSELIICDPRLAMKILLLVNSSLFSFVRKIHEVEEAVVMLGIGAVKRWVTILLLVSESEAPKELFRVLLARAKALELYACNEEIDNQSDYFSLGLFSGLDAILGLSIESITSNLSLKQELTLALLENDGAMGTALSLIKTIERYDVMEQANAEAFIKLNETYWQGLLWADELMEKVIKS